MIGLVLAVGALIVAAIEVVVIVVALLVIGVAIRGVTRRPDDAPVRLAAGGVPRQLVERRHGGRRGYGPTYVVFDEAAAFDGQDVPGCDR